MPPPDLATRLRALLDERGLSVAEAARDAGMHKQQLQAIVTGRVANPGILTVQRIIAAAGGTMCEVFCDPDDQPMPDFRKVQPGESVTLGAEVWNAIVDAAEAEKARRHSITSDISPHPAEQTIVRLKNATGGNLPRHAIVDVQGGPVFTPGSSREAFLEAVTFRGSVPTSTTKHAFAVLLDPIPAGGIGRATVGGIAACQVNLLDAAHVTAEAVAGDTSRLQSVAGSGKPQNLLWAEGGTGTRWALVRQDVGDCGCVTEEACTADIAFTFYEPFTNVNGSGQATITVSPAIDGVTTFLVVPLHVPAVPGLSSEYWRLTIEDVPIADGTYTFTMSRTGTGSQVFTRTYEDCVGGHPLACSAPCNPPDTLYLTKVGTSTLGGYLKDTTLTYSPIPTAYVATGFTGMRWVSPELWNAEASTPHWYMLYLNCGNGAGSNMPYVWRKTRPVPVSTSSPLTGWNMADATNTCEPFAWTVEVTGNNADLTA